MMLSFVATTRQVSAALTLGTDKSRRPLWRLARVFVRLQSGLTQGGHFRGCGEPGRDRTDDPVIKSHLGAQFSGGGLLNRSFGPWSMSRAVNDDSKDHSKR
jgi:hypothetical protein